MHSVGEQLPLGYHSLAQRALRRASPCGAVTTRASATLAARRRFSAGTTAVFGDDPSDRKPPVDPVHARNMAAGLKIFKEQVRAILVSRCVKCHGRVDQMDEVRHTKSLSMTFCLDCHRNPHEHVRPQSEVFNLDWEPSEEWAAERDGAALVNQMKVRTSESCSACHR